MKYKTKQNQIGNLKTRRQFGEQLWLRRAALGKRPESEEAQPAAKTCFQLSSCCADEGKDFKVSFNLESVGVEDTQHFKHFFLICQAREKTCKLTASRTYEKF